MVYYLRSFLALNGIIRGRIQMVSGRLTIVILRHRFGYIVYTPVKIVVPCLQRWFEVLSFAVHTKLVVSLCCGMNIKTDASISDPQCGRCGPCHGSVRNGSCNNKRGVTGVRFLCSFLTSHQARQS
ncbi:hypothetical protein RvY_07387 [Ramazzottius varieornatus]|uniref:Uncharacterized protein n=1 Tax=Ramazzottius varieornatus TaxID=947166 RepID=A0A1D1V706_RAMVA|nr:hypothetical protein RvY_07387 [Ramazzottius varieornatus]